MVAAFRHIMTIAGLHLDMTDILEVEGHPALDDVGPVEADVMGMMTGSAFDGLFGGDDLRESRAIGGVAQFQVPVFEIFPKSRFRFGVFGNMMDIAVIVFGRLGILTRT